MGCLNGVFVGQLLELIYRDFVVCKTIKSKLWERIIAADFNFDLKWPFWGQNKPGNHCPRPFIWRPRPSFHHSRVATIALRYTSSDVLGFPARKISQIILSFLQLRRISTVNLLAAVEWSLSVCWHSKIWLIIRWTFLSSATGRLMWNQTTTTNYYSRERRVQEAQK